MSVIHIPETVLETRVDSRHCALLGDLEHLLGHYRDLLYVATDTTIEGATLDPMIIAYSNWGDITPFIYEALPKFGLCMFDAQAREINRQDVRWYGYADNDRDLGQSTAVMFNFNASATNFPDFTAYALRPGGRFIVASLIPPDERDVIEDIEYYMQFCRLALGSMTRHRLVHSDPCPNSGSNVNEYLVVQLTKPDED